MKLFNEFNTTGFNITNSVDMVQWKEKSISNSINRSIKKKKGENSRDCWQWTVAFWTINLIWWPALCLMEGVVI